MELEEDFRIKGIRSDLLFRITEGGVFSHYSESEYGELNKLMLTQLLTGESEIIKLPWKPKFGEAYYIPVIPCVRPVCEEERWKNTEEERIYYEMGFICKTGEEAVALARRMLAVAKEAREDG